MHVFSLFLFPIILLPRIGDLVLKKFVSTAFLCGRMSQIFFFVSSSLIWPCFRSVKIFFSYQIRYSFLHMNINDREKAIT